MPENKELIQYWDEHLAIRIKAGMHFYPDIECCLSNNYLLYEQRIKDFKVYEDDIWVMSFSKCGTTWSQEMVWLVANNLDYKGAEAYLQQRYAYLELSAFFDENVEGGEGSVDVTTYPNSMEVAENMPRPRFIKSHLPVALLPTQLFEKKPKIFLVLRDPRDVAVSYLNHERLLVGYSGTAEKFYEAFLAGCLIYGSYWHYTAAFWKLRHEPYIMITTYESMKKDLPQVIRQLAKFLGKTIKEEDMPGLLDHLSFNKMKANNATNYRAMVEKLHTVSDDKTAFPQGDFMRKGQVGDYKNAMSPEMVKKFEQHHAEMKRKLGLADDKEFPY